MTPIRLLPTRVLILLLLLGLAFPGLATAQNQPPDDDQDQTAEGDDADEDDGDGQSGRDREEGIQPYDEVITDKAETDEGVFTVHQLDDKVFYEIPEAELGEEFLWVSQIERTTAGVGYGGQGLGNRVVTWERHGDQVLLKSVSYTIVADDDQPIHRAVDAANNDTIIKAFDIEALSEAGAPVIEVTSLFDTEVPEFSARSRLQARGFARDRSFVEEVVSFPENIEVTTTHTYTVPPPSGSQTGSPTQNRRRGGMRPRQRHRRAALQHGEAARGADAAPGVRRAGRVLLGPPDRLRPGRAPVAEPPLHHTVAAREAASGRRGLRPGDADHLLDRPGHSDQVGALHEERGRGLAAGVRGGRVQQRRDRARGAVTRGRPRLEPRGRPLLGHPLAALDHRERLRTTHPRPAHR